jgi:repressor LexA
MVNDNETLSTRQQCISDYIRRFWRENNYPPSLRDIVAGCHLSSTSVADYNLRILESRGYIRRHRDVSRGIEPPAGSTNPGRMVSVPIIGLIAAGQPIPVPDAETWDVTASADVVEVSRDLVRDRQDVYALRVKGTSMIDALINDGDIILLQNTNTVENGEMAAVWLKSEKEATLKHFYAEDGRIRLQPANSRMKAIMASPENVEVQGRVIAVIRQV